MYLIVNFVIKQSSFVSETAEFFLRPSFPYTLQRYYIYIKIYIIRAHVETTKIRQLSDHVCELKFHCVFCGDVQKLNLHIFDKFAYFCSHTHNDLSDRDSLV